MFAGCSAELITITEQAKVPFELQVVITWKTRSSLSSQVKIIMIRQDMWHWFTIAVTYSHKIPNDYEKNTMFFPDKHFVSQDLKYVEELLASTQLQLFIGLELFGGRVAITSTTEGINLAL